MHLKYRPGALLLPPTFYPPKQVAWRNLTRLGQGTMLPLGWGRKSECLLYL